MTIVFRGRQVEKWVVISTLKQEGWKQTRSDAGDILYRKGGDQLTVVRLRDWREKNWDGPISANIRECAIDLAEDRLVDWQE